MTKQGRLTAATLRPMQRLILLGVALLVLVTAQLTLTGSSSAATGTWVDGSLPVLTLGERTDASVPPPCYQSNAAYSAYYNPNGSWTSIPRQVTENMCITSNGLGEFAAQNNYGGTYAFIRPHTSFAYRVLDPIGKERALTPVPNQSSFVLFQPWSSMRGSSINFYDDFRTAGTFGVFGYGSGVQKQEIAYKLSALNWLKDAAGNPITALNGQAFSNDGQWLVVETGHGFIRINTTTREMLLFSTYTNNYNLGFTPVTNFAISDDGTTVLKSGTGGEQVFDLSSCTPAPIMPNKTDNPLTGCRMRDLGNSLRSQLVGFETFVSLRFAGGDSKSIQGKLSRMNNGVREYYHMTYAIAGYQPPHTAYLALGDSFSSGEGAYEYEVGTDNSNPYNKCHLSKKSYPYLAANALGIADGFRSVACSGAKTEDYDKEQDDQRKVTNSPLGDWLPGFRAQKQYLDDSGSIDAITISMVGNDIGFSNKIKRCIGLTDTCFRYREDRESIAQEIYGKFGDLVKLYTDIKQDSQNARVYVLGYPNLFDAGNSCDSNVYLNAEEREMSRGLVTYLNAVIKAATEKAGVIYIGVENTFGDHLLCGTSKQKAVNGVTAGGDLPNIPLINAGLLGNETFHPNALGQQLMAQALLAQSSNLTKAMPIPNATALPPYIGSAPYNTFMGDSPSGSTIKRAVYASLSGVDLLIEGADLLTGVTIPDVLKPTTQFDFWFNSTPTHAGTLTTDNNGQLTGTITVPTTLPPGFHTLHIYGLNMAGETLDLSRTVYIAASANDIDGDGIPNTNEACLVVEPAHTDTDRDNIDDACDPEITEPPADTQPPANTELPADPPSQPITPPTPATPPPADTTPPTITGTPDRQPGPNTNGWYTTNVTLTWITTDPQPSSGTPTQPSPTSATLEGEHVYTSGPSCDPAGNCASGSYTLKIDTTAPTIDFQLSSPPSSDGWHAGPVTITFICHDTVSGVASCSEPVTVSQATIVTGYVTDQAGNTAGINAIIAIDSTQPTIHQTVSPSANPAGWHATDVTVGSECDDSAYGGNGYSGSGASGDNTPNAGFEAGSDSSGIAFCSPPAVITTEGSNQPITSTAVDRAGNTNEAVTLVSIDKTAPVLGALTWDHNPKAASQTALLTIPATDNLSGIVEAEYFLGDTDPGWGNGATMQVVPQNSTADSMTGNTSHTTTAHTLTTTHGTDFPTGVYKVSVRAKDVAGNWSQVVSDYLVVYNPTGVRMTGKRTMIPSLTNGDRLPGLTTTTQTDIAKFGFNVRYDSTGQIHKQSDFQFSYRTGSKCGGNKPTQAQNCHSFELNATTIEWLTTQGNNSSIGIFQGVAKLTVDGAERSVQFRLTGLDGERLDTSSPDRIALQVYEVGDNPNTTAPVYRVDGDVERGNVRIRLQD